MAIGGIYRQMHELDDIALLREYSAHDSEKAFATLVTRHIDRVYSVALRHTRNPHSAEEITQVVFVILARKSKQLRKNVILEGWLYQTARLTALTFLKSEIRRARREQEASMQMVRHLEHSSRARLDPTPATEGAFQRESLQRVNQGKQWGLAFRLFAQDNGGQLPTSIAQLKSYAPGVSDLNWEIVSGGKLDSMGDPGKTILMRNKESRRSPAGRFYQEYVFADGSVQQDSRPDDDFAALEKERGYLVHPAKN